jgi:hypothetical protein
MRYPTLRSWLCAIPILVGPALAMASSIEINGVCESGDCTTPSAIGLGSTVGPNSLNVTNFTINADSYDINITAYGATYLSGTYIYIDLSATYTGSAPSTSTDTIQVDQLQDFTNDGPGTWDGNYTEDVPVIVGDGTTFQANLCYDLTQCVGQVGPLGGGTYDYNLNNNLVGLDGEYLDADFDFVFTFPEGTLPGTSIDVPASVPEPAQRVPVVLVMLGGLCAMFLRRRRFSAGKEA